MSESERGVSPVIGVIIMVAVTVILAAVIMTYVMNAAPPTPSPEQAEEICHAEFGNDSTYADYQYGDAGTIIGCDVPNEGIKRTLYEPEPRP